MTLEEFFAALEKTPRDWYGGPSPIRRDGKFTRQCPLTAVAGFDERGKGFFTYIIDSTGWKDAARSLGLRLKEAEKIAHAADGVGEYGRELRQRLLAACGLA